jgi:hypothetical protein
VPDPHSLLDLDSRFEWSVRYCDHCESEQGGGIADRGDLACSACGRHDAPHEYVPIVEAEALAEALAGVEPYFIKDWPDDAQQDGTDMKNAYEAADRALAAYRARHPKEPTGVGKSADDPTEPASGLDRHPKGAAVSREEDINDYYIYCKSGHTSRFFSRAFTVQASSFQEASELAGERFAGYWRRLVSDGEMIMIQDGEGGNMWLMRATMPPVVMELV